MPNSLPTNAERRSGRRCESLDRARSRTRTDDPLLTMEVLYQLSYPGGRLTIAPQPQATAAASAAPRPSTSSSVVSHEHMRRIVPAASSQT
jgi:hypothetical protein